MKRELTDIKDQIHRAWTMSLLWVGILMSFSSFRPMHEYYVSITRMQFNPSEKSLEVSIRLFTDDFERALSAENNNQPVRLQNNDGNNAIVERYIRRHFVLTDKKRNVRQWQYVGKENEADATWIYLEIPQDGQLTGFSLKNDILMEIFDTQVNVVNIKINSDKKTLLYKKGKIVQNI